MTYKNKIIYNGNVLIDISSDTVTVDDVVAGVTFHLRDGTTGTGTIVDGNAMSYGITDGTLPLVGVAKAGYAEI